MSSATAPAAPSSYAAPKIRRAIALFSNASGAVQEVAVEILDIYEGLSGAHVAELDAAGRRVWPRREHFVSQDRLATPRTLAAKRAALSAHSPAHA